MLKRPKSSHKGDNGVVLIVSGSELYTGAPALCGIAAFRAGADLVYVAAPERAANIIASNPNFITINLPGKYLKKTHLSKIRQFMDKADVVVIGPGLGKNTETKQAVIQLAKTCSKPMVIDADALKALKGKFEQLRQKAVLTPHKSEFKLISGLEPNKENAKKFAKSSGSVVLLKAPEDIITDGKQTKTNKTGNSGMTVGGTGDVLAGIVAALIGQGESLFNAAFKSAQINGKAGDLCKKEKGYGFTASDLIEKIPELIC